MFPIRLTLPRVVMLLVALLAASAASAQDHRRNRAGEFDFYVLSLSWSPSFCEAAAERGGIDRARMQCGGRPYSFVVHGLWPQFDKGYPQYCEVADGRLSRDLMSSMLDLMPAPGLIYNEWDKHGTCSGLSQRDYFDTLRKAHGAVKIPAEYGQLTQAKWVAPREVTEAFIKANPGLSESAITVTCNRNRLSEVRVCLGRDLHFRACEEVARRGCRRDRVVMPPVRGGYWR